MNSKDTRKKHADLVDRMAETLGVDLEEKILEGQLEIATLGDVVLSCTKCSDPSGCEKWLSQQTETAPEAPPICRNAEVFEWLKLGRHV